MFPDAAVAGQHLQLSHPQLPGSLSPVGSPCLCTDFRGGNWLVLAAFGERFAPFHWGDEPVPAVPGQLLCLRQHLVKKKL